MKSIVLRTDSFKYAYKEACGLFLYRTRNEISVPLVKEVGMGETRFVIGAFVALCLLVPGGCASKRSSVAMSGGDTPLPASLAPDLTRFEDLPNGSPASANTEQGRVDAYLAWLQAFELAKLQTNTQLAERLKALAPMRIPGDSEAVAAFENDSGRDNSRSAEETFAALKEVTATTEKIATTFRSRPEAPSECEALAKLYATALAKNLGTLRFIAEQRAADTKAIGQGGYDPGLANRAAGTTTDNGAAEMAAANEELQRLFQRHPKLKTAPFRFAF